jgi:hypothetical protein
LPVPPRSRARSVISRLTSMRSSRSRHRRARLRATGGGTQPAPVTDPHELAGHDDHEAVGLAARRGDRQRRALDAGRRGVRRRGREQEQEQWDDTAHEHAA